MSVDGTECQLRGQSVGRGDRVSVEGTECQLMGQSVS